MKYKLEIKSHTGIVLFVCERDYREPTIKEALEDAVEKKTNLQSADLQDADLQDANLQGANLRYADLRYANLQGANLRYADLRYAYFRYANLRGATGINKQLTSPLYVLLEQPGKIRAYKLVKKDGVGPYNGGIKYKVGKSYSVDDADTCEEIQCGKGINLATMDWCLGEWSSGHRILIAEFEAKDIAAIPIGSDGKFRVHRCKIVGEKSLKDLDWPPKEKIGEVK